MKTLLTKELFSKLKPNARIIDCSLSGDFDTISSFKEKGLCPSEIFYDTRQVATPSPTMKNLVPTLSTFLHFNNFHGISNNDDIILYERSGNFRASARVWWLYHNIGHKNVKVINFNITPHLTDKKEHKPIWTPEGSIEKDTYDPTHATKLSSVKYPFHMKHTDILENLTSKQYKIVDARGPDEFYIKNGRIPGSLNMLYTNLIADGTIDSELVEQYLSSDKISNEKVIHSCATGITASVNALAFYEFGGRDPYVYQESFQEWISLEKPIIKKEFDLL